MDHGDLVIVNHSKLAPVFEYEKLFHTTPIHSSRGGWFCCPELAELPPSADGVRRRDQQTGYSRRCASA